MSDKHGTGTWKTGDTGDSLLLAFPESHLAPDLAPTPSEVTVPTQGIPRAMCCHSSPAGGEEAASQMGTEAQGGAAGGGGVGSRATEPLGLGKAPSSTSPFPPVKGSTDAPTCAPWPSKLSAC